MKPGAELRFGNVAEKAVRGLAHIVYTCYNTCMYVYVDMSIYEYTHARMELGFGKRCGEGSEELVRMCVK